MQIYNQMTKCGKINSVSCLTEFHQASFVGVFGVFPGDASPKPDRQSFSKLFEQ